MKKKLIKISTVPGSLNAFCEGQLKMLSDYFEVVVVSSPGQALQSIEKREGVRVIAIPMERHISVFRDLTSLFRLIRLFWQEKPDGVHSMTPKAGLLAMMASCIARVPVRIHTFTGLVFPTARGLMQKLLIAMDRLTCACATYINPEGQGVKRDMKRFHITDKPLHVIANGNVRGVKMEYYDRTPEVMHEASLIRKPGVLTFCFIGRLVRDKGINELVEAFTRLYEEHRQIRLLLIGLFEPQLDPLLPETLNQIKKHPAIDYVGRQSDVRPFLAASDVFVFPSYREGFPNVVLEAGAMGLPSIVTDINGSNEIIVPGENGEIIPSRDSDALFTKMKEWVELPEKIRLMAANSRRLVAERYEQKMIWKALLKEYKALFEL